MKYLNKLPTIIENFQFFWNTNQINLSLICPNENSVTFNYELGYDSQSELDKLDPNHKKPLLITVIPLPNHPWAASWAWAISSEKDSLLTCQ